MAETKITSGDDRVVIGDDAIVTTDQVVQTTDETVTSVGALRGRAVSTLLAALGPLVDDDYLPGKTRFRDVVCAELGLSLIEAEELIDDLERSGRLRFVATEEVRGWEIEHLDV